MRLSDFRDQVRDLLGTTTADAIVTPTRLNNWVNLAVSEIATERDWPWLDATSTFNTVDGTAAYDLPADWRDTRSATVDGRDANVITVRTGDVYLTDFDDYTTVWNFALDLSTSKITLYPTPTEVLEVVHRYVCDEPTLVGDDDEPKLPNRWSQAVLFRAAAHAARNTDDPAGAGTFDALFSHEMQKMRNAVQRAHGPRRVRIRPGGFLQ